MADTVTRSFTTKRSRATAAEIRRRVLEGSYIASSHQDNVDIAGGGLSAVQRIILTDLTTPVDVEEALSSRLVARTEIRSASSTPQRIRDLTEKDIDVVSISRQAPFKVNPIPSTSGHVSEICTTYNRDYSVVERKYESYSGSESYAKTVKQRPTLAEALPKQVFEGDESECFADSAVVPVSVGIGYPISRSISQAGEHPDPNRMSTISVESNTSSGSRDEALHASTCDPIIPNVTSRSIASLDDAPAKKKSLTTPRTNLLVNLMPPDVESEVVERKIQLELPTALPQQRLVAKMLKLQLDPAFEPLFCSAALYDITERKKVSENFYFDLNTEDMLSMVRGHLGLEEEASKCRQALFSVSDVRPGLFLVFKLEKVLQAGDVADAAEPYVKDERNWDRLEVAAREFCDRLGRYRMPLGWTAIDLNAVLLSGASEDGGMTESMSRIDEEGMSIASGIQSDTQSIISVDRISTATTETLQHVPSNATITSQSESVGTLTRKSSKAVAQQLSEQLNSAQRLAKLNAVQPFVVVLNSFFRADAERLTDEELIKILVEARKSNSFKISRLKAISCEMKVELSISRLDEIPAKLTPELLQMVPFTREIHDPLTKDVLSFPRQKEFLVNAFYRNLLYVHPKSVNFTSRPGNARNIAVRVQLVDSTSNAHSVIFGKSSTSNFTDHAYTTVLHHCKTPQFGDEIKINLPADLDDGHHLLFTFMHVSCKAAKTNASVETPVGYTWHPLYKDGQLRTGDFTLPISLEPLPQSMYYLSPLVHVPSIKWLDGHKPLFSVSISAVSTVHPQDPFLAKFFMTFEKLKIEGKQPSEGEMVDVVKAIIKTPPQPLVSFMYSILDRLLQLIASPPFGPKLTSQCFETLCHLVKVCTMLLDGCVDDRGRSQLLSTYIHYHRTTPVPGATSNNVVTPRGDPTPTFEKPPAIGKAPLAAMESDALSRQSVDLSSVIEKYEQQTSTRLLSSIDETAPDGDRKLVHEEVAAFFVKSQGSTRETACTFSWFFLELLAKSMAEYLGECNRFFLPRKLRFRSDVLSNIQQLTSMLIADINDKVFKDLRQAKSVNSSLAFFLRDLLSLMDRSYVINLIRNYLVVSNDKISSSTSEPTQTSFMVLRVAFLRIVTSHEHFTLINLPFDISINPPTSTTSTTSGGYTSPFKTLAPLSIPPPTSGELQPPPASPSGSGASSLSSRESNSSGHTDSTSWLDLTPTYRSKHFLLGVILSDLAAALHCSNVQIQAKMIGLVKALMSAHENDERLSDVGLKNRIAALYLPLVSIVLDARSCLHDPYDYCLEGTQPILPRRPRSCPGVNPKVAMAISGLADPPMSFKPSSPYPQLSRELTQQLLVCFLWTVKNIDTGTLRHWLRELAPQKVQQFLDLLQLCVSAFEHDPPRGMPQPGSTGSSAVVDNSAACATSACFTEAFDADDTLTAVVSGRRASDSVSLYAAEERSTIRWRFEDRGGSFKRRILENSPAMSPYEIEAIMERQLANEATLVVIDTLETVVHVLSMPASDHLHYLKPVVVRLLMHALACRQSVQSLEAIFRAQRSILSGYGQLIFEERTELCGELCLQLLRHFASRLPIVRSHAAASLYLLMRQAFEASSSFAKVKMQVTMALSTLVSNATVYGFLLNEAYLRRSLKTLLTYLDNDLLAFADLKATTFGSQVKDLVFNLHMILTDTVKMRKVSNDFEMLIDLMFRISKGYQTNPDLRLTWLINIANKHAEHGNCAEAAQCMLHCAALVCEYLNMKSFGEVPLPIGAATFEDLSENILEESATSDDVVSPDDEGICESAHFSVDGFIHLIEKAARFLEKAQMYELLPVVYRLVMPIFEKRNDFARMSEIHSRIADQLKRIDPPIVATLDVADPYPSPIPGVDKRCFGTYFRVGFYGLKFGDLNGEEFVYKEPAITKLSEISHRLEGFYAERFGRGVVEVIKDSNDVDTRKLNSEKAYLQITYVEPYLEVWEKRQRTTHFERNYNLRHFVYATPFTKDGKAHGDLKDQFKRRTILTIQHAFPYLKTRLHVIARDQVTFSPIEVAIEDIQKKTRELAAATLMQPPDAKMLQMVLQGCIGTTVNVGPVQIARVFLSNIVIDERGKPVDRLQNKLRLAFKDFSKKCSDALMLNERLIGADQANYQRELRRNYAGFTSQLSEIMGTNKVERMQFHHPIQLHTTTSQALAVAADLGPVTSV